jgi:hypothetical protein
MVEGSELMRTTAVQLQMSLERVGRLAAADQERHRVIPVHSARSHRVTGPRAASAAVTWPASAQHAAKEPVAELRRGHHAVLDELEPEPQIIGDVRATLGLQKADRVIARAHRL